jgi:DNA-binding SARP family transcriptional activator
MGFRLLGPLQVGRGPHWSTIRANQQRVVLAVLLAESGRVVSADQLIDEVWGERPPRSAAVTLQGYVARLRRLLDDGSLVTRDRGYELVVAEDDVDATVFDRGVAAGRAALAAGDLDAALRHLSGALALWRGRALADVPASPTVVRYADRLERSRLDAVEARLDTMLALGRHAEVVGEASTLVDEDPLRERFWAQLMLAHYRSGHRAEALAAYRHARQVLADQLGLEPSAELRELEREILEGGGHGGGRVTPAQLPADIPGFTGRDSYLKQLDGLLPGPDDDRPVLVISTIAGAAGVGKTALAVHWAHRVRERFPDGQLYVNLRGYAAGEPLRPVEALAGFLVTLGVPAEEVPTEDEPAAALYRSLLAGKRMLVLLDNARAADQVRPLLPGSPGCLVLVTSRDRLGGLIARDGAIRLDLDALTVDESVALLTRLLGPRRAAGEPAAVAELARRCDHLPLALRIAGANLAAHPVRRIAAYAAELAGGDRLRALEVDGDAQAGVRVAFDHSYLALPADAQRLFRLLGLPPGPDITAPAAAALGGIASDQAGKLLRRLAAAHLIDESTPDRYVVHDLLRHYAAQRAATEDGGADRQAALDRLYGYYVDAADAASALLYPHVLRPPHTGSGTGFDAHAPALAWLDAELANLVAAVVHTAEAGPLPVAWRLGALLRGYFVSRVRTVEWGMVAAAGVAAADADGDPHGRIATHLNLALLQYFQRRPASTLEHATSALELARQVGWREGTSSALNTIGNAQTMLGQLMLAADCYSQALAIDREIGWSPGQATKLTNLGATYTVLGQLELGAEKLTEALDIYRQTGSRIGEGEILARLGGVYHTLGRFGDAVASLTEALAMHRELGDTDFEVQTLRLLAEVHRDDGRPADALRFAESAVTLARESGDRWNEANALDTRGAIKQHLGQYAQAIGDHQQAVEVARTMVDHYLESEVLTRLATARFHLGQLAQSHEDVEAALSIARRYGYRVLEGQALTTLAEVYAGADPARAFEYAERALAVHIETGHRLGLARTHAVTTTALRQLGRGGEARQHEERAAALFAEIGAPPGLTPALPNG